MEEKKKLFLIYCRLNRSEREREKRQTQQKMNE